MGFAPVDLDEEAVGLVAPEIDRQRIDAMLAAGMRRRKLAQQHGQRVLLERLHLAQHLDNGGLVRVADAYGNPVSGAGMLVLPIQPVLRLMPIMLRMLKTIITVLS